MSVIIGLIWIASLGIKRRGLISAEAARDYLRQGALVVDVRTADEFKSSHLPEAVNIPLDELQSTLPRRVPDKNHVMLLHCLSGARSGLARSRLKRSGYANVFNLGSLERAKALLRQAR